MPAKRWNIDLEEIMDWVINGEKQFDHLMAGLTLHQAKPVMKVREIPSRI